MIDVQEMDLKAQDSFIAGYWIDLGSGMTRDANWERIDWLVANRLEWLARAAVGPDALYRDPRHGRLWEKVHPAPQLKDGGPPQLQVIAEEAARQKYGAII